MLNEIIAIYAITDDLLTAIGHEDDIRCEMSDAEIITTALCCTRSHELSGNKHTSVDNPQLGLLWWIGKYLIEIAKPLQLRFPAKGD